MAKTKALPPVSDSVPVPIFYADQLAALAAGPYVCRLTFGVQEDDDTEYPRAVVTVAIPTPALLRLLEEVGETVADPAFRKKAAAALLDLSQVLAEVPVVPKSLPGKKNARVTRS